MAGALLSFGFFTYRSPHHGSKIWQKITSQCSSRVVGAAAHTSRPAVLLSWGNNGTYIVELWLFEALLTSRLKRTGTTKLSKLVSVCRN